MDAYWNGDLLQIELEIPGARFESIELHHERHTLTVRAERSPRPAGIEMLVHEQSSPVFTREVLLDERLDPTKVEAHYENGILYVSIPVADSPAAQQVDVLSPALAAKAVPAGAA